MTRLHLPLLRDPLVDSFARRVRYLRVSVTDRCNYRCSYCMPEELSGSLAFHPRAAVLTFEEISRLVTVFARLGVRKVRLTGGEPTIRRGIVDLVAQIAGIGGIEQVVMTTNGHLLGELARPLREAGLSGVNVSLDTLDADRFAAITSRGDLARVLAGLDAAAAAGLRVNTNAVVLPATTDAELVALARDAWARGATPRFIEHMPMSSGALYEPSRSSAQIRAALEAAGGPLVAIAPSTPDAGPARYWALATDPARRVGVISAMTEHFCGDCNRLRLTATGDLHACLGHDDATSLRDILRAGGSDDEVIAAIDRSVTGKREGHTFTLDGGGGPQKHMIGIGG